MNQNKFSMITVVFLFFSIMWYLQNSTYVEIYLNKKEITLKEFIELLYYMNSSASGFSSIQNYSLVYLVPFLLLLQQYIGTNKVFKVTRYRMRGSLYIVELKNIIIVSIIISSAHTIINVMASFLFFENSFIFHSNLIYYSIINGFCLILFYTAIGLIYSLIKNITLSSGIGIIGTLLIVGDTFFISKLVLTSYWTPLVDLAILTNLFEGGFSTYDIAWVYVKQITGSIVLFLIGSIVYTRKDFL